MTPGRRVLRWGLRLIGPALLVAVLWRVGDPAPLWRAASNASLPFLGAVLVGDLIVLHLKVERWRALLRSTGREYPLGRAYQAMLTSVYLGMVTPGRVGDVLRVQYLRRDIAAPYAEGLAVSAMDRICDLYVLAGFVAVSFAHFASILHGEIAWLTWVTVGLATLAPLALFLPGVARTLVGKLYGRLSGGKQPDALDRFVAVLRGQIPVALRVGVPLTIASFLVNYAQGYLIADTLGVRMRFSDVAGVLAITSLLGLMPISISGVGVREMFLAIVFPELGLSADQGVAFGLAVFVAMYLVYVVAGFVTWQIAPPPFDRTTDAG